MHSRNLLRALFVDVQGLKRREYLSQTSAFIMAQPRAGYTVPLDWTDLTGYQKRKLLEELPKQ